MPTTLYNSEFPQPENKKCSVWHYMSLPKFISILDSGSLYLTRVDKLDDKLEGTLPDEVAKRASESHKKYGVSPESEDPNIKMREETRRKVYVCCWHENEHESEAMWRLYCGQDEGVAIRTSYDKLLTLTKEVAKQEGIAVNIGKIKYLDYKNDSWEGNWPENAWFVHMHKRKSFVHENEIRLIHVVQSLNAPTECFSKPVNCDLQKIVDRIYISPYASSRFAHVVHSVVEKYKPELTPKVQSSDMAQIPKY